MKKENKNIVETRDFTNKWNSHIIEQGGSVAGLNRAKVVQLLKRLMGTEDKEEDDIFGTPTPVSDENDPNDAMPADGRDDDAGDVTTSASNSSEEQLSLADVNTVLNQLRNTGGLSFEDIGNSVLSDVRNAIKKTIDTLASRSGVLSSDKEKDKKYIKLVGKRILNRLETAFENLFEPKQLVGIQEVLKTIEMVEKQALNESKNNKISIVIREGKSKPGLWTNIHAKRKRGEKPAKLGDKNYPDKKQWDKLTEGEYDGEDDDGNKMRLEVFLTEDEPIEEAEYQGRKVTLNKPMKGDVKKSKVYVRDPSTGNVKKVNFGDPNMTIKKNNPERRKSFRARHNCDNPGPKTKARYWSCKAW